MFDALAMALVLGMEACLWLAIAAVIGLPQPAWLFFGLPLACAVATRSRWFVAVAVAIALAIYLHPAPRLTDIQNSLIVALALRGAILGQRFTSVAELRVWIVGGLIAFIALGTLWWPAVGLQPLAGELTSFLAGFIALGIVAAILLQRAEIEVATLGRRGRPTLLLTAAILAPFAFALGIAALVAGGGPPVVGAFLWAASIVGTVIAAIVAIPLHWIDAFFAWLAKIIPKGTPGKDYVQLPDWKFASPPPSSATATGWVLHIDFATILGIAAFVALLAALVAVLAWTQLRRRGGREFVEERSSVWSWSRLRDDAARLFGRRSPSEPGSSDAALPPVREIYRATLRELAEAGRSRRSEQTPAEFHGEVNAADTRLGAPLAELTFLYEGVRYGETKGDEGAARAAAARIKAACEPAP